MRLIRDVGRMSRLARAWRRRAEAVGLVPTMGALHEGHLALIRAAARAHRIVVVSIFVNPLQFGPSEDYRRYPRPLARDLRLARSAGADVAFVPAANQMYPEGFSTEVLVRGAAERFEGAIRPGHFLGVATVVARLFGIVQPSRAFFGQKDYQQLLVIRRMVEDLRVPVVIRMHPTVREPDGLALSSRNAYLTAAQRRQAAGLYDALRRAAAQIRQGARDPQAIARAARRRLARVPGLRVDYVAAVRASDLAPLRVLRGRVVLLGAVRLGGTRLIDNVLVDVP